MKFYLPLTPLRVEVPTSWIEADYPDLRDESVKLFLRERKGGSVIYFQLKTRQRFTRLSFQPNSITNGAEIVLFTTRFDKAGKMKGIQSTLLNYVLSLNYYQLIIELDS